MTLPDRRGLLPSYKSTWWTLIAFKISQSSGNLSLHFLRLAQRWEKGFSFSQLKVNLCSLFLLNRRFTRVTFTRLLFERFPSYFFGNSCWVGETFTVAFLISIMPATLFSHNSIKVQLSQQPSPVSHQGQGQAIIFQSRNQNLAVFFMHKNNGFYFIPFIWKYGKLIKILYDKASCVTIIGFEEIILHNCVSREIFYPISHFQQCLKAFPLKARLW